MLSPMVSPNSPEPQIEPYQLETRDILPERLSHSMNSGQPWVTLGILLAAAACISYIHFFHLEPLREQKRTLVLEVRELQEQLKTTNTLLETEKLGHASAITRQAQVEKALNVSQEEFAELKAQLDQQEAQNRKLKKRPKKRKRR